jgi:outer membrane protein assembly factor BamB
MPAGHFSRKNKDSFVKVIRPRFASVSACFGCLIFALSASANENWPQWRGPSSNGTSDSTNLPTKWSLERNENIVWKTELPSWSGSTPIIWGDHIFITSPSRSDGTPPPPQEGRKGGRPMRDPGGQTLLLICLSKKDGSIRWQRELDHGNWTYNKQNSSSPSPVTDGKHVWVVTGNGVVTALDFDGQELWKENLQKQYGKFGLNWGYGSSPLLFKGKVIIEVLHGNNTDDPSYLVAFDAATGNVLWRKERPTDAVRESPDSYTTPVVMQVDGKPQIIVYGGDYVTAHNPETGDEIWRAGGFNPTKEGNYRTIASPLIVDQMVYASAPQKRMPLLAIRAGGEGDVTESHRAWSWDTPGVPDVPTPVSDGKYLYLIGDLGIATCLNAKTGEKVWAGERLNVGTTSASPLLADGKIYVTGENGVTAVIAAGPEFKPLALNDLDGSFTLSSIAVSGQQLFLRTSTHLYCIGNQANK